MAELSFTGGEKLKAALEELASRVGDAQTLQVGFMEGASYPDGTSVAMVAAIQNYGAPAANIPARPFFSGMVKEKSPTWGSTLGKILVHEQYQAEQAMDGMGEVIAAQLQDSIQQLETPALAPATVAAKGFANPLIDTGHMLNSIQYSVDGEVK